MCFSWLSVSSTLLSKHAARCWLACPASNWSFLDALDEIILFQDHFWSIGGDGLTLIGELLVAYAAIRHLIISNARADTDALTGLYNRRYHEQTLMQRIRTAGRTTDQLA